jgi:DNA-binding transcriptional regulator YdaS (Cro superfamily)
MANEYLKTALTHAGLTAEGFADIISVDPKTVQRWIAGRTPYARHRATISRALDIPEHELWPEDVPAPAEAASFAGSPALPGTGHLQGWSQSDSDSVPNPVALLTDIVDEVDLLDENGALLQVPGLLAALENLASRGCRIRVIMPDPAIRVEVPKPSDSIEQRTLSLSMPDHSILRVDDTLLLVLNLHDQQPPPIFALQRQSADDLFNRLCSHVDERWDQAEPLSELDDEVDDPDINSTNPDVDSTEDTAQAADPLRRWPHRPE